MRSIDRNPTYPRQTAPFRAELFKKTSPCALAQLLQDEMKAKKARLKRAECMRPTVYVWEIVTLWVIKLATLTKVKPPVNDNTYAVEHCESNQRNFRRCRFYLLA